MLLTAGAAFPQPAMAMVKFEIPGMVMVIFATGLFVSSILPKTLSFST
jgi:hypothetical protein